MALTGHDTTAFEVVEGVDLNGRLIVVTGGAGKGCGIETSRALARAGAEVVIATRDADRGEAAAQAIRSETGNNAVRFAQIDLASLKSVRRFVEGMLSEARSIDVLINNAAIAFMPSLMHTEDGFEAEFGTNYIGPFALVRGLAPLLKDGGGARVLLLTSGGHKVGNIPWDDVTGLKQPYEPGVGYHDAKLALCLLSVALTRRYGPDGVFANAVSPGAIYGTSLNDHLPVEIWKSMGFMDENGKLIDWMKTPQQGAATTVWGAVAPELEGRGGLYLEDCAIGAATPDEWLSGYDPRGFDPVVADRLWAQTEAWLAERGY